MVWLCPFIWDLEVVASTCMDFGVFSVWIVWFFINSIVYFLESFWLIFVGNEDGGLLPIKSFPFESESPKLWLLNEWLVENVGMVVSRVPSVNVGSKVQV